MTDPEPDPEPVVERATRDAEEARRRAEADWLLRFRAAVAVFGDARLAIRSHVEREIGKASADASAAKAIAFEPGQSEGSFAISSKQVRYTFTFADPPSGSLREASLTVRKGLPGTSERSDDDAVGDQSVYNPRRHGAVAELLWHDRAASLMMTAAQLAEYYVTRLLDA